VQQAVNRAFYRAAPDCLIATDVTTEVFFTTLSARCARHHIFCMLEQEWGSVWKNLKLAEIQLFIFSVRLFLPNVFILIPIFCFRNIARFEKKSEFFLLFSCLFSIFFLKLHLSGAAVYISQYFVAKYHFPKTLQTLICIF
jgi:hypothetical protein